ncbi:S-adenosylmethionine:tRNA ribosyltransferase-isomerase [Sphaerisporangium rubeum]|uniref:S-adenosylmethionine:tRNA ribosyltransferase-isomerase n=1 Tax=Sphaerisporangium rubeum TaxID=321317 RepID=A0A7X0IA61_9ACTN|nr:S-adenosylmethionine:tRNA ribosyltransferase-isomerase [Sphaerisporangium rubeum]MBB6471310.1 S-adenosylmethionine:tRNA ribosyltransferase-isomerase [Sphaerisporangium rubeum]
MITFELPAVREAHEPPEARGPSRDAVRLMVSGKDTGAVTHHDFTELPDLLQPGDLLVVNDSATLPAAVPLDRLTVHFSTEREDGLWLVELRRRTGDTTVPYGGGEPGEWLPMPGGATLRLLGRETPRLWRATLDRDVPGYLREHGKPIRYSYVSRDWPLAAYQTVFGVRPGSAEMPSAGRPFSPEIVTGLVARGVLIATITLHTGVASPEKDEPPYAERFSVPAQTARLVNQAEGRVVAVGTTVVRALESAVAPGGRRVRAARGWTSKVVTPQEGVRVVDGLITGLHEPRSSHLLMLTAIAGEELLARSYEEAIENAYLWHEFGDVHMIIPDQTSSI